MESTSINDPITTPARGNGMSSTRARVSRLGERLVSAIDSRRDSIARGMNSAAWSLRDRAEKLPGAERLSRPAQSAARFMESAANYVRDHDARGMARDAGQVARDHPGATLLTGAVLGFLVMRAFSRR